MNQTENIVKTISEIKLSTLSKEELEEVLAVLNLKSSEASWRLNSQRFCDTHFTSIKNN